MVKDKINIAKILKNCPTGMELDCVAYDNVSFCKVDDEKKTCYPILCYITDEKGNRSGISFTKNGCESNRYGAKCLIFPKGKTTWEGFVPPCKFKDGCRIVQDTDVTREEALVWLEKQYEETSWKPSKEEMDVLYGLAYITNQYDEHKEEVITRLYQDLKREFFNSSSYENMFPNTEDGVRRRSTIQVLEYVRSLDTYNQYGKADIDKNIAWLEKQCEQNPYSGVSFKYNGHIFGMCARDNGVEILVDGKIKERVFLDNKPQGKSMLETVQEEKIDNTNKIEPKFKVGNIIKNKYTCEIATIEKICDSTYMASLNGTNIDIDMTLEEHWELVPNKPNKFDINTLKPFESRVLVRDYKDEMWRVSFWGCLVNCEHSFKFKYDTVRGCYKQCIPYEGNEHLLGTTNDCNDFYKNWE